MHKIIHKYLKYHSVNISKDYLEDLLVSNANFPSILCISDVLERLSISCNIGKISKDSLMSLGFPYILHIERGEGELFFAKNKKDLSKNRERLKYWNGTVIKIHAGQGVRTKKNIEIIEEEGFLKRMLTFLFISILALLFISRVASTTIWRDSLLLLCTMLGVITGYLLIAKDLGIAHTSIENFCYSKKDKRSGCDQILNSKAARVFGKVRLSDLTFAYFSFQTLLLGLSKYYDTSYFILGILNFITIPVIFFSLYFQYFKAKIWCRLCLIVNVILVVQVTVFGFHFFENMKQVIIQPLELMVSFLLFSIILTTTVLIKRNQKKINDIRSENLKYKRVAESTSVFSYLLQKEQRVKTTSFHKEIILGNSNAPIKLVIISSLYCVPCKIQHEVIDELILTYPEKIQVTIRFLMDEKDHNRETTATHYILSYWLKNIYGKINATDAALEMLHDWFEIRNLWKFMILYPLKKEDLNEESKAIEKKHYRWVNESNVAKTPTFFINGHTLPENYTLESLAALIPELSEKFASIPKIPTQNKVLEEI